MNALRPSISRVEPGFSEARGAALAGWRLAADAWSEQRIGRGILWAAVVAAVVLISAPLVAGGGRLVLSGGGEIVIGAGGKHGGVAIGLHGGRRWVHPVYQLVTHEVWVEPVYETRARQVWREPVYEMRRREVPVEAIWRVEAVEVIDPPVHELRPVVTRDRFGRIVATKYIKVCVRESVKRVEHRRILVRPACVRVVEERVCVCPGRWETAYERVCVRPGHHETVTERVCVREGHWEETGTGLGISARIGHVVLGGILKS